MLVTLIFILYLLFRFFDSDSVFSGSSLSRVGTGPCDRDGVREHRCAPTRSDGTGRARRRAPEWSGLQPIEAPLCVDGRFDEAGVAKDTEVFGDGRLRHTELTLNLANRLLVESQEAEDRATVGLGDDLEGVFHVSYMPYDVYTCQGIFEGIFGRGCG